MVKKNNKKALCKIKYSEWIIGLYPISVKTGEPIGSKPFVSTNMTTENVNWEMTENKFQHFIFFENL